MIDTVYQTIGTNISEARNALLWTQGELAERTKLSRSVIGKIESFNATSISIATLSKIAEAFGIPAYVLVLRGTDWKKIAELIEVGPVIERHACSMKSRISKEEVEEIEYCSRSLNPKRRKAATMATKAALKQEFASEVAKRDSADTSTDFEQSMTAATAIAIAGIPGIPIVNGVIAATLVS